jgi:hypothetical protein
MSVTGMPISRASSEDVMQSSVPALRCFIMLQTNSEFTCIVIFSFVVIAKSFLYFINNVCAWKTAVLSQQGRVWQSADRLSRTLIINPSRSKLPRKPTFISQKLRK